MSTPHDEEAVSAPAAQSAATSPEPESAWQSFILSQRQRTTVGAAITVVAVFVILIAVASLLWLVGAFFSRFSGVFLPLAVAGIIALILKPYYEWFSDRLNFPQPVALIAVLLMILIPLAAFGYFLGGIVVEQTSDLISKIPEWWKAGLENLKDRWPKMRELIQQYNVDTRLQAAMAGNESAVLAGLQSLGLSALSAGAGIFGAIGKLAGWAVLPVYIAFFLLIDLGGNTKNWSRAALPFLKTETREDITYLVNEFVEIIVAFFRGQFVIAFLQGVLYAIGFEIVGLSYGLIIGLVLGFLNVIPYLGSIVGLGVALPLALFQNGGGWSMVVGVIVVFTIVQMIEGYVLTPRIMGEQTGLHPMAIIIAIFFWGSALNGITGMILAIPLTAFFVVFWRLLQEKYIQELV